jgi:ATP-dependent Lhr-like helicase
VNRNASVSDLLPLDGPGSAAGALDSLSEPARRWFCQTFGEPTAAQRFSWPVVAAGDNLLIAAPTGSGKTLAAFLPILDRLLTGRKPAATPWSALHSGVRCLYVAPLKALVHDTCRSLQHHLSGLADITAAANLPTLAQRTGDSPAPERRLLHDCPPDLLLTTPESLSVLLTHPQSRSVFSALRCVVVDELHTLAPCKRGADLALSLERLEQLAGVGYQRIGISATAAPLAEAARFLVGAGRSCRIAAVPDDSSIEVAVRMLPGETGFVGDLIGAIEPHVRNNRSTLVFTNTRRLAELLSWGLRRALPDHDEGIAVHHSALAAERRLEIECAFKEGRLRAVVSTATLEVGIDIGSVDQVILVQPPGDIVRFLQRLGRAGHAPGRIKRALVLTADPTESLEAAVTAASGRSGQCEPLGVSDHPLDVLCQHLLGMAALESCFDDDVFACVRRAYPYRNLSRADFNECLAYLFGVDRHGQPWLPARLRRDEGGITLRDRNVARLLRRNLGSIVADEQTPVVQHIPPLGSAEEEWSYRPVGEVTVAFAERLRPGDRFLLDGRCLECRAAEADGVVVEEVMGRPAAPTWGGEGRPMSAELARRLYRTRVHAAELLRDGADRLADFFRRECQLDKDTISDLIEYFRLQECVSEVPDEKVCLIEAVPIPGRWETTCYVHTPLNRVGNDALARVVTHRLARDHGRSAASLVADLGFAFVVAPRREDLAALVRELLTARAFETDLHAFLAESLVLRARFRRVAQTGLMLLRNPRGKRRRVGGRGWPGHQLYDQVRARDPRFVLLRQAEYDVRREVCDADAAINFVTGLPQMGMRCRYLVQPSPFVHGWTHLIRGPQESPESREQALRRLHRELTGVGG